MDRLHSVIQQASERCPDATLGFLIEGLEHYLTQRERREFKVGWSLCRSLQKFPLRFCTLAANGGVLVLGGGGGAMP